MLTAFQTTPVGYLCLTRYIWSSLLVDNRIDAFSELMPESLFGTYLLLASDERESRAGWENLVFHS